MRKGDVTSNKVFKKKKIFDSGLKSVFSSSNTGFGDQDVFIQTSIIGCDRKELCSDLTHLYDIATLFIFRRKDQTATSA